jgi:hypothetical protein
MRPHCARSWRGASKPALHRAYEVMVTKASTAHSPERRPKRRQLTAASPRTPGRAGVVPTHSENMPAGTEAHTGSIETVSESQGAE